MFCDPRLRQVFRTKLPVDFLTLKVDLVVINLGSWNITMQTGNPIYYFPVIIIINEVKILTYINFLFYFYFLIVLQIIIITREYINRITDKYRIDYTTTEILSHQPYPKHSSPRAPETHIGGSNDGK